MDEREPIGNPELAGMTPEEAMNEMDRREALRTSASQGSGELAGQNPSGQIPSFILGRIVRRPSDVSGVE